MMHKILLIDDDIALTEMLEQYLVTEGFDVTVANDGQTGAQYVLAGQFDLTVLDVMMPKLNGIETLRIIRQASHIPVIMLTAKGDESERVMGLESGADDYVAKPCTPRELLARIRALLRRSKITKDGSQQALQIVIGGLTITPAQRRVEVAGKAINLTSTEFNLLEILAKNAGHVVCKEDLALQAMGRTLVRFDRSVDVHMSSIRQKIGTSSNGSDYIQTVYRMGYQLIRE
ncbi:two component transcriptional regulator, winged helix family [Methylotenera versatilis 301]|uniref:Two component transcriptional regulator, winged helix family n=2 Tax=Methylotenera TaxID=359407 RepID=D7DQ34_METV0|nr:two component transcriptional regulator, winged helix family [Methylotenera versatilis 301]